MYLRSGERLISEPIQLRWLGLWEHTTQLSLAVRPFAFEDQKHIVEEDNKAQFPMLKKRWKGTEGMHDELHNQPVQSPEVAKPTHYPELDITWFEIH